MIGSHCGKRMINGYRDTPKLFSQKCVVCRKVFTQHKRVKK